MSAFWDAAVSLDSAAAAHDESARFRRWQPAFLRDLFASAPGLAADSVTVWPIEVDAAFADFDDYWTPFLGGQGPAPAYAMSLDPPARDALREVVRAALPVADDGTITLGLRAWAVRARAAGGRA